MSNTIPRMRGIKQAIAELKAADSNTAFTEKALRRLILCGEVPAVRVGKKYLVNMDVLEAYLCGSCAAPAAVPSDGIHVIAE